MCGITQTEERQAIHDILKGDTLYLFSMKAKKNHIIRSSNIIAEETIQLGRNAAPATIRLAEEESFARDAQQAHLKIDRRVQQIYRHNDKYTETIVCDVSWLPMLTGPIIGRRGHTKYPRMPQRSLSKVIPPAHQESRQPAIENSKERRHE